MKPYEDRKTSLTPAEKLRVAVAVLNDGWEPHRVAALLGVHPDLVAAAVSAVGAAVEPAAKADLGVAARIAGLSAVERAMGESGKADG
jgi:hypothetical protein